MGAAVSLATAPLSMAATCCGSLAGSCAASLCCRACSCACVATTRVASIFYVSVLMVFVFGAWFFRDQGGDIVLGGGYNATAASILDRVAHASQHGALDYWNKRFYCAPAHPSGLILCCANVCSGVFSVYRFSFTLCIFFAALTLFTAGNTKFGARVHRGFWFLKVFFLFAVLVSTLFIDNEAMSQYREVARYASLLFLCLQIVLLIDFGYRMNEWMVEKDEQSESESPCTWKVCILVSAAVLYIASIVMWVFEGNFFAKEGCHPQKAILAITIILTVLLSVLSCTKIAPHGTLLTSSVVTVYASYLCYSALASHPDAQCNPFVHRTENSLDMLVGFVVLAVSMGSVVWSALGSKDQVIGKASSSTSDLTTALETGGSSSGEGADADGESVGPESWWYYHLMMVVCSFYMAMLLSDWSIQPVDRLSAVSNVAIESFWVKLVSQWLCLLMYAWTLLAPYLLRDVRDFGVEFDFD